MVTFKHLKAKEAIEQATLNYQTEILRDALIGGVSHELRTPLAAILGSCSVLKRMPAIANDRQSRELVEAINEQAGQLDNEIRNLLDATRISAKGVRPQLMWSDPTDIVNAALKQKERRLATHRLVLDIARDVPLVHVDTVLIEQALGQLLENAAKYSPAGSEIRIQQPLRAIGRFVGDRSRQRSHRREKGQVGRRLVPRRLSVLAVRGWACGLPAPSSPPTAAAYTPKAGDQVSAPRCRCGCRRCPPKRRNFWKQLDG